MLAKCFDSCENRGSVHLQKNAGPYALSSSFANMKNLVRYSCFSDVARRPECPVSQKAGAKSGFKKLKPLKLQKWTEKEETEETE